MSTSPLGPVGAGLLEPHVKRSLPGVVVCCLVGCTGTPSANTSETKSTGDAPLRLGNFSVGLAVKDLAASREFYEKLGFHQVGGNAAQNWLILQNESSTIGLFHGPMFTKNVLTFNPGWDRNCSTLPGFDDVRDIQRTIKSRGLVLASEADESSTGPASLMLFDPDGNPILLDQHVPAPRK
jgi:catechol 2,3-dioxygenase-like lactoylglutathione lyase family enzyme